MTKRQAEELRESLAKFGVCQPLVINLDDQVIGGHQRLNILKKQRLEEVDVYVPSRQLTDKEAEELAIRLNKNQGVWDMDILANEFEVDDLVSAGFDLHEFGISDDPVEPMPEERTEKPSKLIITFKSIEDLQEAENRISGIVDSFEGAFYKIAR